VAALSVLMVAGPGAAVASAGAPPATGWEASWGLPMAWGYGVATNATVRQLVALSIGGQEIRVRLSNAFGTQPLLFGAASVAVQAKGAALVPGSSVALTFGGSPEVTATAGEVVYSDPVSMTVQAGETLAVSVYVPGAALASVHPCCAPKISSYFTPNGSGNHVGDLAGSSFRGNAWGEWVDAVDVGGSPAPYVVAALGDSITDGFRSAALSWPQALVERMASLPVADRPGVIDEGITANTLTTTTVTDALKGGGPAALSRIGRDVLSHPAVRVIVLAEGTNDLWFGASAGQVIAGMQQVIALAHHAGVRVVGTTILPRAGSDMWTPAMEQNRLQVNQWVRSSGAFDGVVDFARVIEDAYDGECQLGSFFPPFDSGDHLHPDPAGETAMADALDTALLGIPSAPALPVVVSVTSTVTPATATPSVTPTAAVTPTVVARQVTIGPGSRTPGCDPGPLVIAGSSPFPAASPTPSPSPSPSPVPSPRTTKPATVALPSGSNGSVHRWLLVGGAVVVGVAVLAGMAALPVGSHRGRTRPGARPGPGGSGRGAGRSGPR
jgi:lysophospholipase L1-like esterase